MGRWVSPGPLDAQCFSSVNWTTQPFSVYSQAWGAQFHPFIHSSDQSVVEPTEYQPWIPREEGGWGCGTAIGEPVTQEEIDRHAKWTSHGTISQGTPSSILGFQPFSFPNTTIFFWNTNLDITALLRNQLPFPYNKVLFLCPGRSSILAAPLGCFRYLELIAGDLGLASGVLLSALSVRLCHNPRAPITTLCLSMGKPRQIGAKELVWGCTACKEQVSGTQVQVPLTGRAHVLDFCATLPPSFWLLHLCSHRVCGLSGEISSVTQRSWAPDCPSHPWPCSATPSPGRAPAWVKPCHMWQSSYSFASLDTWPASHPHLQWPELNTFAEWQEMNRVGECPARWKASENQKSADAFKMSL